MYCKLIGSRTEDRKIIKAIAVFLNWKNVIWYYYLLCIEKQLGSYFLAKEHFQIPYNDDYPAVMWHNVNNSLERIESIGWSDRWILPSLSGKWVIVRPFFYSRRELTCWTNNWMVNTKIWVSICGA